MRLSPLQRRVLSATALAILILLALLFRAPHGTRSSTLVSVPEGASLIEAAATLHEANIIVSPTLLRVAVALSGGASSIKAGDYLFERPQGAIAVARRLTRGEYGVRPRRVLLPEGSSSKDMGRLLAAELPKIDAAMFAREARAHEGYLFPDTYFFLPTATSGSVIATLRETFEEKAAPIVASSSASTSISMSDAIIMASILEEEAQRLHDRRIVAGILWKRLREGMRLQVDAPFFYLLGKASHELTQDNLALDSPYNTYRNEGLPPAPISNPGLDSIMAAYDPVETEYWFYLSDSDGVIHYATTFEEHTANKERYLGAGE